MSSATSEGASPRSTGSQTLDRGITYRDDVMARAVPPMLDGAARITALLG